MPKIFNEKDRSIIRENLIQLGLEALGNGGYKAASIEIMARKAGIAKGTFYNFFSSKERFYYEIMLSVRDKNRQEFYDFIASNKSIDKTCMENFLYQRYAKEKNIYHYFTQDDLKIIFRKIPDQISISHFDSTALAAELFSKIPNTNPQLDHAVVVNMMNIMGSYAADDGLISMGRDATLRLLSKALATYIFEGGKSNEYI